MDQSVLIETIAAALNLKTSQVAGAITLLDDGNTIPFIARYRKERTGVLDEEQLRAVAEQLQYLRALAERKETVLASIAEQGKLTAELREAIESAKTLQVVEDLYLPYRPKRRTRATVARELGLEPLAQLILAQPTDQDPASAAQEYLSAHVDDAETALAGARDIIAEQVAEAAPVRQYAREQYYEKAALTVEVKDDPQRKYETYYNFDISLNKLQPHQILAINRGETEKALKVSFADPKTPIIQLAARLLALDPRSPFATHLQEAVADGYERLLKPSVEREVRRALTDAADDHAIEAFQKNLRALLLQPPIRNRTIMGIDPAYRTGCKVAVCDPTGKVLEIATIYPHEPQNKRREALQILTALIEKHTVGAVAIGNGTASRETEQLVAELLQQFQDKIAYGMVNEAGASVYSASPLARKELPDLDVSIRGAVSIARRLQDPLAELVKIDPKSIGVGLYQHDVDQKKLAAALDTVVESVVNNVGVNINTASPALLQQVAGLTPRTAENIVAHRDQHGPFHSRLEILKVSGVGPKAFEQAAGFLRIPEGDNPLDNTGIHPESYPVVERLVAPFKELGKVPVDRLRREVPSLARQLAVGEPTLQDILDALAKPGRDPRDDLEAPILRTDVLTMEDLKEGMWLKGTVRNVVAFGAFVDIGVKQDGLVHVSEIANRFIRDPHEVVSVGDVVHVRVLTVDIERGRIALSMKKETAQKAEKPVTWAVRK